MSDKPHKAIELEPDLPLNQAVTVKGWAAADLRKGDLQGKAEDISAEKCA